MIPDDMLYNPGHLRNCDLPNHALDGKLPDSFSVPAPTLSPPASSTQSMSSPLTRSPSRWLRTRNWATGSTPFFFS